MKVGLFFGSFNPVHIGHLAIANYFSEFSDLQQIWLIISPQNPFKDEDKLISEHDRYQMVKLALKSNDRIIPSKVEFDLPKPSYTVSTFNYLSEKYPRKEFVMIMGSDNLRNLHRWKDYEDLINQYELFVYPRIDTSPEEFRKKYPMKFFNAPRIEISSSFIRESIKKGKNVRYFLPYNVYDYIQKRHLYKE
ncbi:MAG: nicotinate (nicotinamide) nucleotide adenylyltransferase [Bacteroidales bacterium]